MAQGTKAIYLMPVVRTSGWCGWFGAEERRKEVEKGKTEIETKGVAEIGTWTSGFDEWKDWWEKEDSRLKESMKDGFSITRKVAVNSWEDRLWGWLDGVGKDGKRIRERVEEGSYKNWIYQAGFGNKWNLYKNAGVLNLTDINKDTKSCYEVEHYFPLDLVVLGDSSGIKVKNPNYWDYEQKITITDKISQVIGVRLDQVVISKNGIGDGSGRLLL